MRLALQQAALGLGRTSPNPAVGALLVKGGKVIAYGHHRKAGTPHAEIVALEAAGPRAKGADLYTTLEPCDHFGRTPPCTEAILRAGVRRVIYASSDPNPLVNGRGLKRLRRAGVEVIGGVLAQEAGWLNRPFFKFLRTGLPWVTLKAAITIDGKIATATGDSKWITGPAARQRAHQLRDLAEVILVGAGTVEQDNPRLTCRLPDRPGRDPVRLVVDATLRTSARAKVYARAGARVIVATGTRVSPKKVKAFEARGVEVWKLPAVKGLVSIRPLLSRLAQEGYLHLLVEGGAALFGSFLQAGLADEVYLFITPKLLGAEGLTWSGPLGITKVAQALPARSVALEPVGEDLLLVCELASS